MISGLAIGVGLLIIWNVILTLFAIIQWVNLKAWTHSTHQIVGPKEVFNFDRPNVPDFEPVTDGLKEKIKEESEDYRPLGD